MKPRLPLGLLLGGVITGAISGYGKELVPASVDQGSAFLSTGLFLSLFGLSSDSTFRRWFIWPCLFNLALIVLTLGLYFSWYVETAHNLETIQSLDRETAALPRLIDAISIAKSDEEKLRIAKAVYHLYGVKLAYSSQDGPISYYQPTKQEVSDRQITEEEHKENMETIAVWRDKAQKALNYLPGFFAIYLGTFFLTFFFGSLWVAFRKPSSSPNLQP
jgi:hypothetical protein